MRRCKDAGENFLGGDGNISCVDRGCTTQVCTFVRTQPTKQDSLHETHAFAVCKLYLKNVSKC